MTEYVSYAEQEQLFDSSGQHPLLPQLDIELTERCNLQCIHCYINQPANNAQIQSLEMGSEQVKSILNEAAELGCMMVRFTGGEPLLRPDFSDIYIHARKLGLRVLLFTNATLLTPELTDLFTRIPLLEKIEITIYGMTEISCRSVTGVRTAYRAAMRGIELLLNRNIPFIVKWVLLPPNKHELDTFEQWAVTLPWMESPPTPVIFLDLRARRDQPAKNQQISMLRRTAPEDIRILIRNRDEYFAEMKSFCSSFMGSSGKRLFTCGAGKGGCVDAYGRMQPCLSLRHPDTSYDLKTHSLHKVLTELFPELRKLRAANSDYLTRCARCMLRGLCEQCPAKSWMEHGTLDTPVEYLCEAAHEQARQLGLLNGTEKGWEAVD